MTWNLVKGDKIFDSCVKKKPKTLSHNSSTVAFLLGAMKSLHNL